MECILLLCVALLPGCIHAATVMDKGKSWDFESVPEDSVYLPGEPGYLEAWVTDNGSPTDNDDWKVCTWKRFSDGAYCRFDYVCEGFLCDIGSGDFHVEMQCSPQLQGLEFIGEDPNFHNRQCGIKIPNLSSLDSSLWTIEVEECHFVGCGGSNGNGVTREHSSQLTVLSPPSSMTLSSPTLHPGATVTQGSIHQVNCTVADIRPVPTVSWLCPLGSSCSVSPPVVTPGPASTVTVTSSLWLTVSPSPGTFTLECGARVRNSSSLANTVWQRREALAFTVAN